MQSCENFEHKLDSNYWQANKEFSQRICCLCRKISNIVRSIKGETVVLLSKQ